MSRTAETIRVQLAEYELVANDLMARKAELDDELWDVWEKADELEAELAEILSVGWRPSILDKVKIDDNVFEIKRFALDGRYYVVAYREGSDLAWSNACELDHRTEWSAVQAPLPRYVLDVIFGTQSHKTMSPA